MAGVLLITLGFILLLVKCVWFRQPLPFIDEEGPPEQAKLKIQVQAASRLNDKAPEGGDNLNVEEGTLMSKGLKTNNGKHRKKEKELPSL